MNVVIVASSDLWPVGDVVSFVGALLASLPEGSVVGVRAKISADGHYVYASPVEEVVARVYERFELGCRVILSDKGDTRAGTFRRDYHLIAGADRVVALFNPSRVMEGGTGHVIYAALQKSVPVEAWTLDDDAKLTTVGSDEGESFNESFTLDAEGAAWASSTWERAFQKTPPPSSIDP